MDEERLLVCRVGELLGALEPFDAAAGPVDVASDDER